MIKPKPFTMEEVDAEIMQIVQQGSPQSSTSTQPNIVTALLNRAKAKRNGNNATAETPKL